jgi:acyl-CoA thioesterase-1
MKFLISLTISVLLCAGNSAHAIEASKRLLVLGDSLTEGYGVAPSAAFPALVEKKIKASGKNWQVINAGVSGSTTASGPSRLKWQLKTKPDLIILALGANDGLRGLDLKATEKNLANTIEMAQQEKVQVIIAGMLLPPNYGSKYREQFSEMYNHLAQKYKLRKIPFLLEGVAANPKLNLPDGIHPNEKGHEIVAELVYKSIQDLL